MPLPIRTAALIFDMDGTMVDSMPWHAKSWVEFTRRHGIAIDIGELMRRTTGRTGMECMRELFDRELDAAEARELAAEKEAIYRTLFEPHFAPVPGITAFWSRAVACRLKVGIGTAGDRKNIDFSLTRLALATPAAAVVGGDEGLAGKPDPAIFLEAARRMETPPEQCIVFEDAPFGIEAARRAGMRAVALCTTHDAAELAGPHVVAQAPDYHSLMKTQFLESLHVA
jgi:beta-phosphoglucomutase-like phosphatase (HAD superfamily)